MDDGGLKQVTISRARSSLSAIVDDAVAGRGTIILRRGLPQAVIVSFETWKILTAAHEVSNSEGRD
jgi:PHD/YefM family antitoxin component YafN of YafNO toxin-antitoxin module